MSKLKDLGDRFLKALEMHDKNRGDSKARYAKNVALSEFASAWYKEYEVSLTNIKAAREAAIEIGGENV